MSTRPASRITKPPVPRLGKRSVSAETTKPKVKPPTKEAKPTPPSYGEQDQATGSADEDDQAQEAVEDQDEEEAETETPKSKAPAPKTFSRPLASRRPVIKTVQEDAFSSAPHMSILDLVKDQRSMPSKPSKITAFIPNHFRLFAMHSAVSSILSPLRVVHKNDPSYNPVYSRLALAYVATYIILSAREKHSVLHNEEYKVLKAIRLSIDMESIRVPTPYISFLETFGFHIPADKRFDVIVPSTCFSLSQIETKRIPVQPTHSAQADASGILFPHFPSLLYLANRVSTLNDDGTSAVNDEEIEVAAVTTPTATAAVTHLRHWQRGEFVMMNDQKPSASLIRTWNLNSANSAVDKKTIFADHSQNSALYYPFFARKSDLEIVATITNNDIPFPPFSTPSATTDTVDLKTWFGLSGSSHWMPKIFESLEYEAKFFKGDTKVRDIGIESGANLLCMSKFILAAPPSSYTWFKGINVLDEEETDHQVFTTMDDVDEGSLAIANATATIVQFSHPANSNPYRLARSLVSDPVSSAFTYDPFTGTRTRTIRKTHLLAHQFPLYLKTHLLLNIKDAIGA